MGKKKDLYSVEFKINIIEGYNNGDEGGIKALSKKLGFRSNTMLRDWLKKYNKFGVACLDSKRSKFLSSMRDRPKKHYDSPDEGILKLKVENEYFKNFLN